MASLEAGYRRAFMRRCTRKEPSIDPIEFARVLNVIFSSTNGEPASLPLGFMLGSCSGRVTILADRWESIFSTANAMALANLHIAAPLEPMSGFKRGPSDLSLYHELPLPSTTHIQCLYSKPIDMS